MSTDAAQQLRERGVQVTAQRLAVLRAVSAQPHSTADAVAAAARLEIGAISLQSVYDTLTLLVAAGLLRRIQPSGSAARYEDRVGDNHHHLICRSCGRVTDVDCAVGAAPCLAPHAGGGYEIDEAEVAFWGRCPDCLVQAPVSPRLDRASARMETTRAAATTTQSPRPSSDGARSSRNHSRRSRRTT